MSDVLLVVDRDKLTLSHYGRPEGEPQFRLRAQYPISVGKVGHETPGGTYSVTSRSRNPSWTMPEADWVPEADWGKVIPAGDPNNPIKARWLGLFDGVGIHGTADTEEIGQAVSHGCVRMRPNDVKELFDHVPLHTPVVIL